MRYSWLDNQTSQWQQQLHNLSHAYLLLGIEGIGIEDFSLQMAKDILCHQEGLVACNQCSACHLLAKDTHPDLFKLRVLDDKKEISVDQVRELNNKIFETSHQGGYKVALIEQAEKLNTSSFNALLKTLEEPSARTVIILTTYQKSRIPATLLSRCRKIEFIPPSLEQGLIWLHQQLPQADEALLKKSLRINWSAPLKAKNWIESKQFEQEAEWQKDIKSLRENSASVSQIVAKWMKYPAPAVVFDYFYLWSVSAIRAAQYQQKIQFNPNWFVFQKMILQARSIWQQNANKELLLEVTCQAWLQHQKPDFDPASKLFSLFNGSLIRGTQI